MLSHKNVLEYTKLPMSKKLGAEKRRAAFRRFMEERRLKVRPWCKRAGVKENNVYNFLRGDSDSLSLDTLGPLARVEGVTIDELEGTYPFGSTRPIPVVGAVQAGVFKESMKYENTDLASVSVPWGDAESKKTYALDVKGESMNQVYPVGSVLIVVPVCDLEKGPQNGDHVIVERRNPDGLVETTCKELTIADGATEAWLWPRSDDPRHQQPTRVHLEAFGLDDLPPDASEISIIAVVVGCYTRRARH